MDKMIWFSMPLLEPPNIDGSVFFEIKATAAKNGRFKFIACFENGCSV